MKVSVDWIKTPTGGVKLLTTAINIVCIALLSSYGPAPDFDGATIREVKSQTMVVMTTTAGFLMVDLVIVLGYLIENAHGKLPLLEIVYSVAASVMYITSGALQLKNVLFIADKISTDIPAILTDQINGWKAYGGLCIIIAVVYLIFALLVGRKMRNSSPNSPFLQEREYNA